MLDIPILSQAESAILWNACAFSGRATGPLAAVGRLT